MTLKATSLQDLAPVRRALAEAAAQEALLQQQRAEAARRLGALLLEQGLLGGGFGQCAAHWREVLQAGGFQSHGDAGCTAISAPRRPWRPLNGWRA